MSEGVRCPDCDSVKITPAIDEGDGNCSECHGSGKGGLLDQLIDSFNPFDCDGTDCWKCDGTGQCQTCGGSGIVYD